MYGQNRKEVKKGEGETGEDGQINQRQMNESANNSIFCTVGRSHGGGWGEVQFLSFLRPNIVL